MDDDRVLVTAQPFWQKQKSAADVPLAPVPEPAPLALVTEPASIAPGDDDDDLPALIDDPMTNVLQQEATDMARTYLTTVETTVKAALPLFEKLLLQQLKGLGAEDTTEEEEENDSALEAWLKSTPEPIEPVAKEEEKEADDALVDAWLGTEEKLAEREAAFEEDDDVDTETPLERWLDEHRTRTPTVKAQPKAPVATDTHADAVAVAIDSWLTRQEEADAATAAAAKALPPVARTAANLGRPHPQQKAVEEFLQSVPVKAIASNTALEDWLKAGQTATPTRKGSAATTAAASNPVDDWLKSGRSRSLSPAMPLTTHLGRYPQQQTTKEDANELEKWLKTGQPLAMPTTTNLGRHPRQQKKDKKAKANELEQWLASAPAPTAAPLSMPVTNLGRPRLQQKKKTDEKDGKDTSSNELELWLAKHAAPQKENLAQLAALGTAKLGRSTLDEWVEQQAAKLGRSTVLDEWVAQQQQQQQKDAAPKKPTSAMDAANLGRPTPLEEWLTQRKVPLKEPSVPAATANLGRPTVLDEWVEQQQKAPASMPMGGAKLGRTALEDWLARLPPKRGSASTVDEWLAEQEALEPQVGASLGEQGGRSTEEEQLAEEQAASAPTKESLVTPDEWVAQPMPTATAANLGRPAVTRAESLAKPMAMATANLGRHHQQQQQQQQPQKSGPTALEDWLTQHEDLGAPALFKKEEESLAQPAPAPAVVATANLGRPTPLEEWLMEPEILSKKKKEEGSLAQLAPAVVASLVRPTHPEISSMKKEEGSLAQLAPAANRGRPLPLEAWLTESETPPKKEKDESFAQLAPAAAASLGRPSPLEAWLTEPETPSPTKEKEESLARSVPVASMATALEQWLTQHEVPVKKEEEASLVQPVPAASMATAKLGRTADTDSMKQVDAWLAKQEVLAAATASMVPVATANLGRPADAVKQVDAWLAQQEAVSPISIGRPAASSPQTLDAWLTRTEETLKTPVPAPATTATETAESMKQVDAWLAKQETLAAAAAIPVEPMATANLGRTTATATDLEEWLTQHEPAAPIAQSVVGAPAKLGQSVAAATAVTRESMKQMDAWLAGEGPLPTAMLPPAELLEWNPFKSIKRKMDENAVKKGDKARAKIVAEEEGKIAKANAKVEALRTPPSILPGAARSLKTPASAALETATADMARLLAAQAALPVSEQMAAETVGALPPNVDAYVAQVALGHALTEQRLAMGGSAPVLLSANTPTQRKATPEQTATLHTYAAALHEASLAPGASDAVTLGMTQGSALRARLLQELAPAASAVKPADVLAALGHVWLAARIHATQGVMADAQHRLDQFYTAPLEAQTTAPVLVRSYFV